MNARPRLVSLCPSNTEIVDAIGLSDCLVGVDNYSDFPQNVVDRLPKLGPDLHIDVEKVVSLRPDLVICSLSVPGMEKVVRRIQEAALPHIVLSPHGFTDIWNDMQTVAQAIGNPVDQREVAHIIEGYRTRVEAIRNETSCISDRPKLYWEWWPNPVFSPGRRNWLTEVSEIAGGTNIFHVEDKDAVQDDGQKVVCARPDYFFAVWTGVHQNKVPLEKILHRKGWDETPALQKKHVYILSEGLYCRPSPRLVDGLEQVTSLIHPDLARSLGLPKPSHHGPIRLTDGSWLDDVNDA